MTKPIREVVKRARKGANRQLPPQHTGTPESRHEAEKKEKNSR